ncbi:hypothetical protein AGMMS49543_12230 [Betaproteobacteria bacterium]|nr:hypothetical protein AGMMS49543_12230 [Betaproteobacteria bacterium]GHU24451.1 hypothetical protein AGMMS50243_27540 [Betaproteobacteria bacterium]
MGATVNIGFVLFPDLLQMDFTGPYGVFAAGPDVRIHLIGKDINPVTSSDNLSFTPTVTMAECPPLDILCVPGGSGILHLLHDQETLNFLRRQAASCKYLTSVCTGALVLGAAGLLTGYRATTHWQSWHLLQAFGTQPVKQRVVVDRNRITAAGVSAGIDMALTLAGILWGDNVARSIQLSMEYAPEPPYHSGHPEHATAEVLSTLAARNAARQAAREKAVVAAAEALRIPQTSPTTMRPVAIFRFFPIEGPAYFASFLDAHHIPWVLIALDQGAPIPATSEDYSGFCFMGGPMSVNDDLPWIAPLCALIRDAVARDTPVLGHCLGGQLVSKALGGAITRNPVKEIGWGQISTHADDIARHWLGEFAGQTLPAFHWHGETFSLPPGATRLADSTDCAEQIFALGPHLAMQCHVEIEAETVVRWSEQWPDEISHNAHLPSVQTAAAMRAATPQNLPRLHQLADQLYGVWVRGLGGFQNAYARPNPTVTGTNTTWMGHVDDCTVGAEVIEPGRKMGCDMSVETAVAVTLYTPGAPR